MIFTINMISNKTYRKRKWPFLLHFPGLISLYVYIYKGRLCMFRGHREQWRLVRDRSTIKEDYKLRKKKRFKIEDEQHANSSIWSPTWSAEVGFTNCRAFMLAPLPAKINNILKLKRLWIIGIHVHVISPTHSKIWIILDVISLKN